jgi:hypothetical protein
MKRVVLVCLTALAAAAVSWASPAPIVTRGSAALPEDCEPAAVAQIVAARAAQAQQDVVYVTAVPLRAPVEPTDVSFSAGVSDAGGSYAVTGTIDCAGAAVLSWNARRVAPFSSPGSCPEPRGWRAGRAVVACAGLPSAWEVSPDFTVKTTSSATGPCAGAAARTRIVSVLHALNYAHATGFANNFATDGRYYPYTASIARPLVGRLRITIFVAGQMAAVDGWTATALLGPLDRTRVSARYRLSLTAYVNGEAYGAGRAFVDVDCRTGLVRSWSGPALPTPK